MKMVFKAIAILVLAAVIVAAVGLADAQQREGGRGSQALRLAERDVVHSCKSPISRNNRSRPSSSSRSGVLVAYSST